MTFTQYPLVISQLHKAPKPFIALPKKRITDQDLKHIAPLLGDVKNLVYLDLSDNNITATGAKLIASNVYGATFKRIDLSNNSIKDQGIKFIAETMLHPDMESIILHHTEIGNVGAVAIGIKIQFSWIQYYSLSFFMNGLVTLDLSGNNIGDIGAIAIAKGMQGHSNLRELHLNDNMINDHGAIALAQSLEKTLASYLKGFSPGIVDLSKNQIGDYGASGLVDVLKNIANLVVRLSENLIEPSTSLFLTKEWESGKSTHSLDIGSNQSHILYDTKIPADFDQQEIDIAGASSPPGGL